MRISRMSHGFCCICSYIWYTSTNFLFVMLGRIHDHSRPFLYNYIMVDCLKLYNLRSLLQALKHRTESSYSSFSQDFNLFGHIAHPPLRKSLLNVPDGHEAYAWIQCYETNKKYHSLTR